MTREEKKEAIMSMSQAAPKNVGNLCCSPWMHRRNPGQKMKIGILLVVIGLLWLGARAGLLDFSWLKAIYFWPTAFILLGAWMVYQGVHPGERQEQLTGKQGRYEMETMFGKMMEGCLKGMSEEDKKKMMAYGEKMAAMCPSMGMKDMTEEEKKVMREKMMACCGSKMEMMSACFGKPGSTSDPTGCAEKS
jgi:hypothetical protein